jgi:lysosomal acid phosphatase
MKAMVFYQSIKCLLFVLATLFVTFPSLRGQPTTEVKLVQAVFRHGDRTPTKTYPNDPVEAFNWDQYGGLGQLTQKGMKQAYSYGNFLRLRYSNFLNDKYDRNRVCVRSTDYDRTIMTAQSLLAGLFEPVDNQLWNQEITWQPIPIHTQNYENVMIFCLSNRLIHYSIIILVFGVIINLISSTALLIF